MFQLAIIIRLLAFAAFVACVYGGNILYTRLEYRKAKLIWKISFVTLYSFFLLPSPSDLCGLVRILLWFEFLSACPVYLAGHSCLETKKIPMCQLL